MADKQKAGSILRLLNFFNSFSFLSFFILSRSFICFVFLFFLLAYLFCFLFFFIGLFVLFSIVLAHTCICGWGGFLYMIN